MSRLDEIRRAIEANERMKEQDAMAYRRCYDATIRLLKQEERLLLISGISTDRLEAICAAEREGRCVVLPCKVGDAVYSLSCGKITENVIGSFYQFADGWAAWGKNKSGTYRFEDFGKTVFLTRAAADAAKEGKG